MYTRFRYSPDVEGGAWRSSWRCGSSCMMAESLSVQKNPISRVQGSFQQWKLPLPTYREAAGSYSQFGNEVTIVIEGESRTFSGLGRTKKISKANAAQEALNYITQNLPHLLEPPPMPVSK